MEFIHNCHDALSNITPSNFLCCPNCGGFTGIKMLGLRSQTKHNPRVTSEDHILDYSIWFYCESCFTEFGSTFAHREFLGVSSVTVNSSIQKINFQKSDEKQNERSTRKTVPSRLRYETLKKHNFQCQSCGATVEDGAKLEIDHIKPVSKGGTNDPDNLQVLCKNCNLGKSDIY
jgi:5-methylcytosine-specific restriction endonuclease McrA